MAFAWRFLAGFALVATALAVVPLCIMTSDDTDAPTRALLEAEGDFGAEPGQIEIMKQDKVAALSDGNAKLAVDATLTHDSHRSRRRPSSIVQEALTRARP